MSYAILVPGSVQLGANSRVMTRTRPDLHCPIRSHCVRLTVGSRPTGAVAVSKKRTLECMKRSRAECL